MKSVSQPHRSQLQEWRKEKQSHEQVAVGETSERAKQRERGEEARIDSEGKKACKQRK